MFIQSLSLYLNCQQRQNTKKENMKTKEQLLAKLTELKARINEKQSILDSDASEFQKDRACRSIDLAERKFETLSWVLGEESHELFESL